MLCTSTVEFDFFKDKAKRVWFAFFWLWMKVMMEKGGHEAKESFSVVFFQPSCALQEPFKFNTLIYKEFCFGHGGGGQLSVVIDHQAGWRLLFFPLFINPLL